jgi:hypothetical protein
MKRFLVKTFISIIPLGLFFLVTEYKLRKRETIYSVQKASLDQNLNRIETLVLGSSHAFYGINPEYLMPNSFNLAAPGQDFYFDYQLLVKYIDSLVALKAVILPVSYHSFYNSLEFSSADDNRVDFYYHVHKIKASKKHSAVLSNIRLSSYGIRRGTYFAFLEKKNIKLTKGHLSYQSDELSILNTTDPASVINNINDYHKIMNTEFLTWNTKWLNESIKLLLKKGIVPILITTPVFKTHSNNLDPKYAKGMQELTRLICKQHNLTYFNLMKSKQFNEKDFYNANHLNGSGAIKLSNILGNRIDSVLKGNN